MPKLQMHRFSRITRIFGLLSPYKKHFFAVLILHTVAILTRLVSPYVNKVLVDDVIDHGMVNKLYWVLGALIGLAILRNGIFLLRTYIAEIMGMGAIVRLKKNLYRHLQELPFEFYDNHRIGEIMSRLTGDVDGMRHMITAGWVQVLEMVVYFVSATIILFIYSWQVTLLILMVMPFLAVLAYKYDKLVRPVYREIREQNATLNTRAQENISGVRVVKAFAREDYEVDLFDVDNNKVLTYNLDAVRIWSKLNPIIDFLAGLPTPILMLFGTLFALAAPGTLSLGTLVAMNGYLWMISDPLRQISFLVNMVQQTLTSSEKVFYYQDMGSTIREVENPKFPETFRGHVKFDHVYFRYGDETVLNDICFEVEPGKTLAIMGATGSGKTTIVNLLPRFYECYAGAVTIDGIDVKEYQLQPLRRQIGMVMQETFLFSDSLANNIAFGKSDMPQEDIANAAQIAQGAEFISQMADGYEAFVGERGLGLSGGQKQRVSIARALSIHPKILILDDSTSAVDMETEYAIQQGLKTDETLKGATKFIIAHRISSVKDADEIIVLKDGSIAERGTHATLLAEKGLYYEMFQEQYHDYEEMKAVLKEGE